MRLVRGPDFQRPLPLRGAHCPCSPLLRGASLRGASLTGSSLTGSSLT
ncbi:pentapeptide repeat-containing protein [Arthrobacter sp. UYEF20]